MYKPKLLKLLNELKNNINKTIEDHPRTALYINSWVIGEIDMIIHKANGQDIYVYPYKATYKTLFNCLKHSFYCVNASETIKKEIIAQINTSENIILIEKLSDLINQ